MRKAIVKYNNIEAGMLVETDEGEYEFVYKDSYVQNYPDLFFTFQMPVRTQPYTL